VSRIQGGGIFDFGENTLGATGVVSGGSDAYFSEGGVGVVFADEPDTTIFGTGFIGGVQLTTSNRRFGVCPGASASYSRFTVGGIDAWTLGLGGGVAVGFAALQTDTLQVVPSLSVLIERVRLRASAGGGSPAESDTLGVVEAGIGLVVNRRVTFKPSVLFPVSVPDDDGPSFRLTFTVAGR
jgi:hypothetical protein